MYGPATGEIHVQYTPDRIHPAAAWLDKDQKYQADCEEISYFCNPSTYPCQECKSLSDKSIAVSPTCTMSSADETTNRYTFRQQR